MISLLIWFWDTQLNVLNFTNVKAIVKLSALCSGDYLLILSLVNDSPNVPESAGWHLWLWRGARAFKPAGPLHIVLSATQQNQGLCCKMQPRAALSCRQTGAGQGAVGVQVGQSRKHFFAYIIRVGFVCVVLYLEWWPATRRPDRLIPWQQLPQRQVRVWSRLCNFSELLFFSCVGHFISLC